MMSHDEAKKLLKEMRVSVYKDELEDAFAEFLAEHYGVLTTADLQTLAKFIEFLVARKEKDDVHS